MNILYDNVIFNFQRYGGISRYFFEVMKRLSSYNGTKMSLFRGINIIPGRFTRLNSLLLGQRLKNSRFNIYHPTYYSSNVKKRSSIKTIITVFDMIHEMNLLDYPGVGKDIKVKKESISNADHVICISNSTKEDLKRIYGVDENKISVVYLAVETSDPSASLGAGKQPLGFARGRQATRLEVKRPYVLYVGKRRFYKNFWVLAETFSRLNLKKDFDLVCFGGRDFSQEEKAKFKDLGLQDDVKHISGNDNLLNHYYRNATVFVYPSLYEGFGLPVLEAMANDCPVIASNGGSIPEIAGEAVMLFDPKDTNALGSAIKTIVHDNAVRDEYIKRGKERVKSFSWDKTAKETYEVYKKIS